MEDIINHYTRYEEAGRLAIGAGALELARTQEIISRYLPTPPATILDVGGGPGVYSCWLANKNYKVHLIDPVPKHIEIAKKASAQQSGSPIASITLGDSRTLDQSDASADAVLLMGPLYHLTERKDRLAALEQSWRVLRPGGILFAAAINRFASLNNGLFLGYVDDPVFAGILDRDLLDGQHRNPTGNLEYFTTSYFHHPDDLSNEITEAGLTIKEVLPVEGPAWLAKDFNNRWADPRQRTQLLDLIRKVEHEPMLLGISDHLLAVAVK